MPETENQANQQPEPVVSPFQEPAREPLLAADDTPKDDTIVWTASEFIAHNKSASWYLGLGGAAVIIAVLTFLITGGFVSAAVVIVSALLLGVYGAHQPRQLEYRLEPQGFSVGDKHFSYDDFRCFAVVSEGAFSSIELTPLKRFAIQVTMHYPPADEERIMALLGERLPLEKGRRDGVDSLMRRIRF
jgi:hypothetical protein